MRIRTERNSSDFAFGTLCHALYSDSTDGKAVYFTVKDEVLLELEHIIHRYTGVQTRTKGSEVSRIHGGYEIKS